MASSNPLPAQTDDDEGVFEVDGVFDADEVLRRELEQARTCYLRNKPNYFCILCRTRYHEKQIALSHLIPHSVLKSGGKELHTAVSERQLSFLESELGSGPRLGTLEDMFVFTIFLFQDFNKRQVTKLGHRTDTRQVCLSLKSKVYTLSAAKCVSLFLQVIAS